MAVDLLLSEFRPRMADARQFALRNRVLLLQAGDGIGIDVALGSLPFEERCVGRASDWELAPGTVLRTCSAEDLVVLKAFAGRPRDWVDLEAVLLRQKSVLNWTMVLHELEPLVALAEKSESGAPARARGRDRFAHLIPGRAPWFRPRNSPKPPPTRSTARWGRRIRRFPRPRPTRRTALTPRPRLPRTISPAPITGPTACRC